MIVSKKIVFLKAFHWKFWIIYLGMENHILQKKTLPSPVRVNLQKELVILLSQNLLLFSIAVVMQLFLNLKPTLG